MRDAFEKAINTTVEFIREHPVYFIIIALGILIILAPWVIEALGFGELRPIEDKFCFPNMHKRRGSTDIRYLGTFTVWWQARYAGYILKGSLFSFF